MKIEFFFFSVMSFAAVSCIQATTNGQGAVMTPDPSCNHLSTTEQNFASQMMDMSNQKMFCTQFTPQQRQQAMQMVQQPNASMNADQAVQQVMQNSGMMPSTGQPKGKTTGGACPVK